METLENRFESVKLGDYEESLLKEIKTTAETLDVLISAIPTTMGAASVAHEKLTEVVMWCGYSLKMATIEKKDVKADLEEIERV